MNIAIEFLPLRFISNKRGRTCLKPAAFRIAILLIAIGLGSRAIATESPLVLTSTQKKNSSALVTKRPPNLIYVMADDLGYGDLSCYGQKTITTPNLDKMASEGMRFTDHYAGHTVCRPSRLVLWTGKHVGSTGLIGNRPRNLSGMERTVAQRLQTAGYATGGIGKWALGNVEEPSEINNPGHPNSNGFQTWFGYMNQGNAHNFYPPFLWDSKTQVFYPGNVLSKHPNARGRVSLKQTTYSHDQMTDAAFRFIEAEHKRPFLLHMHWTIPHANNEGGRVNGDGMEIPDFGRFASMSGHNQKKVSPL